MNDRQMSNKAVLAVIGVLMFFALSIGLVLVTESDTACNDVSSAQTPECFR